MIMFLNFISLLSFSSFSSIFVLFVIWLLRKYHSLAQVNLHHNGSLVLFVSYLHKQPLQNMALSNVCTLISVKLNETETLAYNEAFCTLFPLV